MRQPARSRPAGRPPKSKTRRCLMDAPSVAVIGAGAWGTTLARLDRPGGAGHAPVPLPGDGGARSARPAATRRGCPASTCRRRVIATADPTALAAATDLVVFAAPSAHLRATTAACAPYLDRDGGARLGRQGPRARDAAAHEPGDRRGERRRAGGGSPRCPDRTSPPRSRATCRHRPSSPPRTSSWRGASSDRLGRRRFRLYVNEDILGVELAGALKNVVAIAAGAADGLGFGDNGKAGLLTRGLAEMMRLGIAAGANPLTFAGLAGMGDLIATCGSRAVAQPPARRGAGEGPHVGRDRGDAAGHGRGRLHGPGGARAGRTPRRRDADRARGRAGAVRGQERPALPRRPAGPRSRRTSWPTRARVARPRGPDGGVGASERSGARLRRLSGRGAVW